MIFLEGLLIVIIIAGELEKNKKGRSLSFLLPSAVHTHSHIVVDPDKKYNGYCNKHCKNR